MLKCSHCDKETEVVFREEKWCGACYQRWWSKGSLEYEPKKVRLPCSVKGCEELAKAKGFCDTHYMRYVRNGHVNDTRPKGWGTKATHPHYNRWDYLKKMYPNDISEPWWDFWVFVEDIGEKPGKARLERIDTSKPWGKSNFSWQSLATYSPEFKVLSTAYSREYYRRNKRQMKSYELKQAYGITIDELEAMLEAQEYLCLICGNPETAIDYVTKQARRLAIDHDHVTGKVRGLLCTNCNTLLGRAKDSITILNKAADYLKEHGVVE